MSYVLYLYNRGLGVVSKILKLCHSDIAYADKGRPHGVRVPPYFSDCLTEQSLTPLGYSIAILVLRSFTLQIVFPLNGLITHLKE